MDKQTTKTSEIADVNAIRNVVLKVFANWTAMNPDANDALYRGNDHTVLFDITPMQDIGWKRQKDRLQLVFASFACFHITPNNDLAIHCRGDGAWVTGTWNSEIEPATGGTIRLEGRVTMVLERHEGKWLVVHDHLSVPQPDPSNEQRDRDAIMAHINGLFQAFIRKDCDTIRHGHTTDWHGFQVESTHIVRGIDDYMKATISSLESIRDTRYEINDIDIKLYGHIAVVFYLATVWGLGSGNVEQPIKFRSIDIYRRESDAWNQCGSNICVVPTV